MRKISANSRVYTQRKERLWIRLKKDIKINYLLYLMVLPGLLFYIIFCYVPMPGVLMAFEDYQARSGIFGSPWVGLKHFTRFFNSYYFWVLIRNTLRISIYNLVVGFPIPIIFALMLNYLKHKRLKKTVQMVSYAPHFVSAVVICGMITMFFNKDTGIVNQVLERFGGEATNFLAKPELFDDIYVWSGIWQEMGWSAIIYVAALAGVDPELHEAAIMDGATKVQRMIHIDIPSIKSTIIMLLILQFGSVMSVGFEKAYFLTNSMNKSAANIISTYVYEVGLIDRDFGFSTAVGLFNSLINMILLITVNKISRKVADEGLF